jgi:hypothetical protein
MPGSIVLRHGVLRGMEQEADCMVLARKELSSYGSDYSDAFVMSASTDLPDGTYVVEFDNHTLEANKRLGLWLSTKPIARQSIGPGDVDWSLKRFWCK